MDKPTQLKPLSEEQAAEVSAKARDTGSMLPDLSSMTKLKPKKEELPDAPVTNGPDAEKIRELYNSYKRNVIGDKEPTDEQIRTLKGIADRLLDEDHSG